MQRERPEVGEAGKLVGFLQLRDVVPVHVEHAELGDLQQRLTKENKNN